MHTIKTRKRTRSLCSVVNCKYEVDPTKTCDKIMSKTTKNQNIKRTI